MIALNMTSVCLVVDSRLSHTLHSCSKGCPWKIEYCVMTFQDLYFNPLFILYHKMLTGHPTALLSILFCCWFWRMNLTIFAPGVTSAKGTLPITKHQSMLSDLKLQEDQPMIHSMWIGYSSPIIDRPSRSPLGCCSVFWCKQLMENLPSGVGLRSSFRLLLLLEIAMDELSETTSVSWRWDFN